MSKLESDIHTVLAQLKESIAMETWASRRRYFNQLITMADKMRITEPCQELYDAFIADDHGSNERRSLHKRCVRLLDKVSGTRSKDENGRFYNPIPLPGERETTEFFKDKIFPLRGEIPLDYLVVKAQIEMNDLCLTVSTMGQYKHAWNEIRHYCLGYGALFFDKSILDQFLSEMEACLHADTIQEWKWKINRKAVFVLYEVAETGEFQWGHIQNQSVALMKTPEMEQIRLEYVASLVSRNLTKNTVDLYNYVFRKMVKFTGITTAEELFVLKPDDIPGVISGFAAVCNSESLSTILPILRSILKELHAKGWMEKDISGAVIHVIHRKRSVSSYISPEDEERLMIQLNYESKRDKAVILLVLRLGLRDCDITELTFNEIDWMNDRIIITQKKTGKSLKLPLLPDVGNALLDYIQNERQNRVENRYIFIRNQAPYIKLSSVYPICSRLLSKLEITPVNGNRRGVHLFRYSLVHKLLKAKIPHQIITDTLGHVSKESDKPYLSMEESMLRQCALGLSVIGSISWEVGG